MTIEEEIRSCGLVMNEDDIQLIKAARAYAMIKSNENNTWFVDYEDIEEAFFEGAKFACAYSVTSNNTERRIDHGSDN